MTGLPRRGLRRYPREMAEIINLNRARKRRARAEQDARAAARRAEHGRTAAQKALDRGEGERRGALLDAARLDEPATGPRDGVPD